MDINLATLHDDIAPIIHHAKKIMLDAFRGETEIFTKGGDNSAVSIVTATDREVDAYLRSELKEKFPDSGFITEETKGESPTEEYVWIIDPIDGTSNFANRIPIFALSLGLWYKGLPAYGLLMFPALDEEVHAAKGHGVFYNGKPFTRPESPVKESPSQILTLLCQPESVDERVETLAKLKDIINYPQDYQSASYHYALVVLGRFDCMITVNLPIWDFGAALIIAEEAGLHYEFITPFPKLTSEDIREYSNAFIMAEESTARRIADRLKS